MATNNSSDYSPTQYNVQIGGASGTLNNVAPGVTGIPLISKGASTNPAFGTAVVGGGGTGNTSFNSEGVLIGNGTGPVTSTAAGSTGQWLAANSAAPPTWQSLPASSITITGNSGGGLTGAAFTFTGGTTGLTFAGSGSTETLGGTLVVSNGGSGAATFTSHGVLLGQGTSAFHVTAVGTTGQVLTGVTGSDPTWQSPAASSVTITGDSGGGLTGHTFTFTGGTSGLTFAGSGSTETLGGTLAIANGGTNATSMATTDGVVYFDGTRLVTTAVGTAGQVLTSNGAGVAPTYQAAGSSGVTSIAGDSGTGAVSGAVTLQALPGSLGCGSTVSFVDNAAGETLTLNVTNQTNGNTIIGFGSGVFPDPGSNNNNTSLGTDNLVNITSSMTNNVAVGAAVFGNLTGGSYNIGIGRSAGSGYTASESSNILLNSNGTGAESNVLRIGKSTGTGNQNLNSAFICGINGITVTGTAVLVSSSDQLGVAVSSRKFKDNIEDMGSKSSDILKLRPVNFNYNTGEDRSLQTGLIAEEVHEIMPSLVVYDKAGEPQTVKYHDLPALLLNELQKAVKRIEVLEAKLAQK